MQQARVAAGDDDICVAGGAATVRQYLHAGALHELRLHIVPVLLGSGVRLFDAPAGWAPRLVATGLVDRDGVAHLRYRIQY